MTLVGPPGTKMGLVAEVKDAKGNTVNLKPKWMSGDAKVATVDGDGVVTSVGEGRDDDHRDPRERPELRVRRPRPAPGDRELRDQPLTLILKVGEVQRDQRDRKGCERAHGRGRGARVDELGPEDGHRVERRRDGGLAADRPHLRRDVLAHALGHRDRELRPR